LISVRNWDESAAFVEKMVKVNVLGVMQVSVSQRQKLSKTITNFAFADDDLLSE